MIWSQSSTMKSDSEIANSSFQGVKIVRPTD